MAGTDRARPDREARLERGLKTVGLVAGPLLAVLVFWWNPGQHPPEARSLIAIVALTVAWWTTEALPLPATALVTSALAIAAGVAPARTVLAPYADPVIFLFMGSFLLAEAFRKYGLDVRVARALLGLRVFARSPQGLLAGFGATSATVSAILSNTATAALLTPVALGALDARGERREGPPPRFDSGVLLMIAYGASIGGMATLIGTPPNLLAAGFLERLAGVRVTFAGWLLFGVPLSLVVLLVALGVTRLLLGRTLAGLADERPTRIRVGGESGDASGERRRGAWWTGGAILLALVLWTAPAVAGAVLGRSSPMARALDRHFPEAGVALLCGALLFAVPTNWKERRLALGWDDAQRINWGVLLLFGGGLSLGSLAEVTGLARWAGEGVVRSGLASSAEGLLLASLVAALVVTEFASNTAAATLLIPVIIAAAQQSGLDPVPPVLGAGLACTCAFVFPVSTPPNAIVFGTGRVPLVRMIRNGVLLDVACLAVIWGGIILLRPWLPHAG